MKNNQLSLDAINILKGIAYSQLMLEDQRSALLYAGNFNPSSVYSQMDTKSNYKVYPSELINYLTIHRIAASERQSQFLIYLSGSQTPFMTYDNFLNYLSNGNPHEYKNIRDSNLNGGEEVIKSFGEREFAKIYEKELQFYRTIEQLKENFINHYGFSFKDVITQIDRDNKGTIEFSSFMEFVHKFAIQFSHQQFSAITRRCSAKSSQSLTYKQIMKLFSPFEPFNFPTYRKQNNFQKALDYINQQVAKLQINTQSLPYDEEDTGKIKNTTTGFTKVMQGYRQTMNRPQNMTAKYFYDQNYYNQLKSYKTNYFDPNKDVKKKIQNSMIGPQYHDHFFSDYYLYLEQRNKTQHYYNKFGKRYTFENPISKTFDKKH